MHYTTTDLYGNPTHSEPGVGLPQATCVSLSENERAQDAALHGRLGDGALRAPRCTHHSSPHLPAARCGCPACAGSAASTPRWVSRSWSCAASPLNLVPLKPCGLSRHSELLGTMLRGPRRGRASTSPERWRLISEGLLPSLPKPVERPQPSPSAGTLALPASAHPPAPAQRRSSRLRRSALFDCRLWPVVGAWIILTLRLPDGSP